MKKRNVKSIQGRQVVPNPIGPECIHVTKVYDWVILTNRDTNKVQIPEECFAAIEEARHDGNTITATCSEVVGTRDCDFIGATPATIVPNVPGAQIVALAFHVHIRVQFFCNGEPIPGCNFVVPVSFMDEVILCFPEGTKINCDIFDVQCTVVLNQMLGDMVVLDVTMCKDVQVEAKVKLEVEAKFCGPRRVIPIPENGFECPIPPFPQQCPTFFPTTNCLCQGSADFGGEATITVIEQRTPTTPPIGGPTTGRLDLTALVCDRCTLSGSGIQVTYIDTLGPTPIGTPDADIDQSFTFTANDFEQPDCSVAGTLTVRGTGVITPAGGAPENADFTIIMTDADPGSDMVILRINGATTTVEIILSEVSQPSLEVEVEECERF